MKLFMTINLVCFNIMLFPMNHDNFWPRSRYYTCIYSIIKDSWEIWPLWIKQSFCVFNFNITKLLTSSHYKEKENHAWFLMVYLLACASMYALVCCTFLKASLNVKRDLLAVYICRIWCEKPPVDQFSISIL